MSDLLALFLVFSSSYLVAQESSIQGVVRETLQQFCQQQCDLSDFHLIYQELPEQDLGFEIPSKTLPSLPIQTIQLTITINEDINPQKRLRLHNLILSRLKIFSPTTDITWVPQPYPPLEGQETSQEIFLGQIQDHLETTIHTLFSTYCPQTCLLNQVRLEASPISHSQAENLSSKRLLKDPVHGVLFFIKSIYIKVLFDSKLPKKTIENLKNLIKDQTSMYRPVRLESKIIDLPPTFSAIQEEKEDPYGLEKLKKTLNLLQEFNPEKNKENSQPLISWGWLLGTLFCFVVLFLFFYRYLLAKQDANLLMLKMQKTHPLRRKSDNSSKTWEDSLKVSHLKEELLEFFLSQPRITKETFSKMLISEGVELVSKYIHIFGKMIIFELLSDAHLSKRILELSEYYQNAIIEISTKDEWDLLKVLKHKILAQEMRSISHQKDENFSFMEILNPEKIYQLISDESLAIQILALSHLDKDIRQNVLTFFDEEGREKLMESLCEDEILKQESKPVAKILQKKLENRPDILGHRSDAISLMVEILQKENLERQKYILALWQSKHEEKFKFLKKQLIGTYTLLHLKPSILLDVVMSLSQEEIIHFLQGAETEIRNKIISSAPESLWRVWKDEIVESSLDSGLLYEASKTKVMKSLKEFASKGIFSIEDVNDLALQEIN